MLEGEVGEGNMELTADRRKKSKHSGAEQKENSRFLAQEPRSE
jgi:hypothetical protein